MQGTGDGAGRRELDVFFSTLPSVAEGFHLKTWRSGPDAGKPKLLPTAKGLIARGLIALKPRCDVHRVAMEVSSLGNHVADIDGDTEADGPIGGLVAIILRHLPLHFHGTLHCTIDAVEHDE